MIPLVDIATDIFSGLTAYGHSPLRDSGDGVLLINIKDIQEGTLDTSQLETVYAERPEKLARYRVKSGDVLVTAKGSNFKIAVIDKTLDALKKPIILSANLCAIRLRKEGISSDLLQAWLESPSGMAQLQALSQGSNILNLRPKNLSQIDIPLLPQEQLKS